MATPDLFQMLLLLVAGVGAVVAFLAWRAIGSVTEALRTSQADDRAGAAVRAEFAALRAELDRANATQRMELQNGLKAMSDSLDNRLGGLTANLNLHFTSFAEVQKATGDALAETQRLRLNDVNATLGKLTETLTAQQIEGRKTLSDELDKVRVTLTDNLAGLRKENETKLEEMRKTVDEKLQSTLDQRLDANFKQVSDRLESVQKGLGEMQTLATGVGDLKRVLTNVKSRGTWGEVQLQALLEDTLTTEQYAAQVQVRPRSQERVDFAVRLPGHDEDGQVWIPIDCKFPHEDYARLVAAQDTANPIEVESAGKALERAVMAQAKAMAEKYIHPPHTTDFAYIYLPTEGLFAELVRREGFTAELRARHRVEIAGPSTLTAMLNALRVGFRSLQIQKKSSEVWTELGKVKTAFERYGETLEAVDKKLDEAKNKVADVGRKHRAVVHSLRNVESLPALEAVPVAALAEALVETDD